MQIIQPIFPLDQWAYSFNLMLQIYFYADYVFAESGIPENKIPYVTLGAGLSELFTALTCVSLHTFTSYHAH